VMLGQVLFQLRSLGARFQVRLSDVHSENPFAVTAPLDTDWPRLSGSAFHHDDVLARWNRHAHVRPVCGPCQQPTRSYYSFAHFVGSLRPSLSTGDFPRIASLRILQWPRWGHSLGTHILRMRCSKGSRRSPSVQVLVIGKAPRTG
jgi:hypothetical protein